GHDAAAQRFAVIVDRAGATLCQPATEGHAVQTEWVAPRIPEGRGGIINLQGDGLAVDGELDGGSHDPGEPLLRSLETCGETGGDCRQRLVEDCSHRYAISAIREKTSILPGRARHLVPTSGKCSKFALSPGGICLMIR